MVKMEKAQSRCKPGIHHSKPCVSVKKAQSLKLQNPSTLSAARHIERSPSSSAEEASSDDCINEEQMEAKKLLEQKARKAKNQRQYYQKCVPCTACYLSSLVTLRLSVTELWSRKKVPRGQLGVSSLMYTLSALV